MVVKAGNLVVMKAKAEAEVGILYLAVVGFPDLQPV